jgi:hypothetical protein
VHLDSVSDLEYTTQTDGCNLALDYPRFRLCARNFDGALYPQRDTPDDGPRTPATSLAEMRDTFFPDAEPVDDDLTNRPAVEADAIAWQLFADAARGPDDQAILDAGAIYIEVRRLSPDEEVTLVVTGLSVGEFEEASEEVLAMLASVQTREPVYTDPVLGWSVAWDHEQLRPSAIPDPDPDTIIYLTEYDAAYQDDGTDIDIWMAHFVVPDGVDPTLFDAEALIEEVSEEFASLLVDVVFEVPEGYESLEASTNGYANTFFRFPSSAPALGVPDYWGMINIHLVIPGRAMLMTMLLWDGPHSEQLLPLFTEFLGSITMPPLPHTSG